METQNLPLLFYLAVFGVVFSMDVCASSERAYHFVFFCLNTLESNMFFFFLLPFLSSLSAWEEGLFMDITLLC